MFGGVSNGIYLKKKITAAFTLGCSVPFLRGQLDDNQTDFSELSNYVLTYFSGEYNTGRIKRILI